MNALVNNLIGNKTIVSQIERNAKKQSQNIMLIFEGESITWDGFNCLANQYSHTFLSMGLEKGDTIALVMENRIEFLAALIGMNKIGVIAGLVNHNLSGDSLVHCIKEIDAQHIMFGEEVCDVIFEIKQDIVTSRGDSCDFLYVADKNQRKAPEWSFCFDHSANSKPITNPRQSANISPEDRCCYIYTSGTTGLPKASIIKHDRWFKAGLSFSLFALRTRKTDRYYLCLPLFHSSALFIGFGSAAVGGASIFLRRKFSASNFLEEAREHQTNTFIYIGELCRYLMHRPKLANDAINPIEKCAGNGLRPDIWMEFKERFGIEKVAEFYGSTEGNIAFMNCFNNDCTIGFSPSKFSLVKYDVLNDEIVRNEKGFCRPVDSGEPGLLVARINELLPFEGYTNKAETDKKILRDVFKRGDAYFNSGDLIKQVKVKRSLGLRHYQFVDRVGDTFRWKGENVSTNEVEEILNANDQIKYSNVYGVELKGTNGRAGMAALMPNLDTINMDELSDYIASRLPTYAQPIFIRVLNDMNTTGTFKLLKGDLKKQAYHPSVSGDQIYVKQPSDSQYVPLCSYFYKVIESGNAGY